MGGVNLACSMSRAGPRRHFADYRNRNNVKMQELKEAIGGESPRHDL